MKRVGELTHSVDLSAGPETVFWTLLENAREHNIDSSFEYWRPRQWPPAVGTHNDFKARLGLMAMKGVSRFAEFEPPWRMLIESVKPTFPFFVRMSWQVDAIGEGSRYTYRMALDAEPGFGWLARSMLAKYDRQMSDEVPQLASLF